jgi:hypothetical protein
MTEGNKEIAMLVISAIVVLGFGGVLVAWMMFPPKENTVILASLTTALGTGYLQVLNYYFMRKD